MSTPHSTSLFICSDDSSVYLQQMSVKNNKEFNLYRMRLRNFRVSF